MVLILNYIKNLFSQVQISILFSYKLLISWFLIITKYSKIYLNFFVIMFGIILFISLKKYIEKTYFSFEIKYYKDKHQQFQVMYSKLHTQFNFIRWVKFIKYI